MTEPLFKLPPVTLADRISWMEDARDVYAAKEAAATTQEDRDLWAHWRRNTERVLERLRAQAVREAA